MKIVEPLALMCLKANPRMNPFPPSDSKRPWTISSMAPVAPLFGNTILSVQIAASSISTANQPQAYWSMLTIKPTLPNFPSDYARPVWQGFFKLIFRSNITKNPWAAKTASRDSGKVAQPDEDAFRSVGRVIKPNQISARFFSLIHRLISPLDHFFHDSVLIDE